MSTGDGVSIPSTPSRSGSSAVLSALGTPKSRHDKSPVSTPERPRKRIKLEMKPAESKEIEESRHAVYSHKLRALQTHKNVYRENLLELFFLQNMGNIMDYFIWRKKPDSKVYQFLKSGQVDSEDEEWYSERSVLSEGLAIAGSVAVVTPTAAASTSVLAGQGAGDHKRPSKLFGQSSESPKTLGHSSSASQSTGLFQLPSGADVARPGSASNDSKVTVKSEPSTTLLTSASPAGSSSVKAPGGSHTNSGSCSAVPESITGTQEAIVERAKQEAAVMQRVSELRRDGMWSSRRLPKVQEPARGKAHWDYLLEEMQWLAADFAQERKWKKAGARKIASMISKYHKERQMKEMRAEKDEANRTRRIASNMAKMVREFWGNIEKIVEYKYQSRLEEKRKKAMDLHLSFIVDQTEKYSTWLTEGLTTGTPETSSLGSPTRSAGSDDRDFEPSDNDEDDEETIRIEEMEAENEEDTKDELDALQKEMELPIEELIRSLPQEVLDKPASIQGSEAESSEEGSPGAKKRKHSDGEFSSGDEDSDDDEETLDKEEEQEPLGDSKEELNDLQQEGEMSIEELRKKYAAAYDSDFEMPEESETETEEEDSESESSQAEEEEEQEEEESEKEEDVGMEYLMKDLHTKSPKKKEGEVEPGSELTDIAAAAQSIQPTGYTLETTKVKTEIPFLLKHTLREYQVVGLDWMATMYDRRLNGILADEMGLGKTIQTIALLAHLACEKGIWGPHLIVVPTSVMLNWEMEIKKWCPAFKILTYFGTQKERKAKRTGWTKTNAFHVCITSYKLVIQDHQAFRRKKWKYFILDEAQNIKNFKSQRWQTLLNFMSQRRLLLTGTPLQNSLMELWSLMHFLMPHVFQSHKDFKEWFANPLTGMIEGSREYNDSLIKRLHKVLRPFLLRRLKSDVEKQMPKKYEHIVKCHLSRRQRFLYDDFMSQTKTKETLATGHYMSVINILMQLRKVCNHPNLFDPRPIVSPFRMEPIHFTTPSIITKALDRDPLECISPTEFHPCLADLELTLPAFVAHRIRLLQTPRKLIEEIDSQPDPPPRLPPAEKPVRLTLGSTSPMPPASGRASPFVPIQQRSGSPLSSKSPLTKSPAATPTPVTTPSVETTQLHQLPGHTPQIKTSHPSTSTPTSVVLSSASTTTNASSQPFTVQIQNTPEGTRLMIPSGQLSQLPGFIQIVQTSSGQQIIATSQPPPNQSSGTTVTNGPTSSAFTMAGQSVKSTSSLQLPVTSAVVSSKPVMKVSPLINTSDSTAGVGSRVASPISPKSVIGTRSATRTLPCKAKEKSIFFMDYLHERRKREREEKLGHLAQVNQRGCDLKPVYGLDQRAAANALSETKNPANSRWHGLGYVNCHKVHHSGNPYHPSVFWRQTEALRSLLHTPQQYLDEYQEILDRFAFVIPAVTAPRIRMRTFHPSPSSLESDRRLVETLHTELAPRAKCLHKLVASMSVQFPEARLIQYDCGKLQTLDILLRQLKSGDHRVLIFTQMTKMLDVLEAFLNFHGYRYLRLDGTTKVEQRQALMERFNADKRIFVFILSTRSGGLGVNLTGADTVIFYDSDWNPTMDAQAQDRCHRIGQTRDVHIYRLISEKTIEENILKKANQKRLLSDVTIEGGNFTTAFFKENTIKELFEEPSGLEEFVQNKNEADALKASSSKPKNTSKDTAPKTSKARDSAASSGSVLEETVKEVTRSRPPSRASSKAGSLDQDHLEQVLCTAEDEGDVQAAKTAKAEQSAELAEFDEDIPWDEKEAEQKQQREQEMSRVEIELSMLEKELTPVERYAVCHMEVQLAPVKLDELEKAEEDVSLAKEEWELSRLKALKEEEERRAELEEDEMLFTYSRDDANNQVYICDETGEQMPMWAPPTPPQDDHDVYIDTCLLYLYEQSVMPETQLPPVYIKKEHKRVRVDPAVVTRKNKTRKEEQARVPKSLFDRPTSLLRRDSKLKLKQGFGLKPLATRPTLTRPLVDTGPEHPEWLIHEDWALLQAVQNLLELPLTLSTSSPGHIPNWDLVADIVNTTSRTYRSAKQCRSRYENVIVPREEGRILYDVNPRKQKKTKMNYKLYPTKNNRPMRTSQLYAQDNSQSLSTLFTLRFDSCKSISSKNVPTHRPGLTNPTIKNLKHAQVLAEHGIGYDKPLNPIEVAQVRVERITREKKEQQQKSQASTSTSSTTTVGTAATQAATVVTQALGGQPQLAVVQGHQHLQAVATAAGTTLVPAVSLQKTATVSAASVSLPKGLAAAAVVNTAGGVSANALATINRKFAQTVVGSLTPNVVTTAALSTNTLSQGVRVAPARTYVQEISAAIAQPRTTTGTLITTMSQAQLPRVALTASTVAATGKAAVQPQISTKLTPEHLRLLQHKHQQKQQQQKATFSALQTSQSAMVQAVQQRPASMATVTTPLITSISGTAAARLQVPKQTITQQTKPRAISETDMAVLLRQQQKGGAQKIQTLSGANQILTGRQQGQSQAAAGGVATLVKAVSSQGGVVPSVTIPVSAVGLGITMPQKQGGRMTQMQVRQLMNQKGRTMTAAQLQTHKATLGQIQVSKAGGGVGTPLIIPQKHTNQQVIVQQIQHLVKQQSQNSSQQQTVQQLITAASSNAATVLVTQAGQPVARLSVPLTTSAVSGRATGQQTLLAQPVSSSTVTVQQASIVKNLQEVVVSPAKGGVAQQLKNLPVSSTTLRTIPAIPGLTLAQGQAGTVNIQQIQQQAKQQAHAPSPGQEQGLRIQQPKPQ